MYMYSDKRWVVLRPRLSSRRRLTLAAACAAGAWHMDEMDDGDGEDMSSESEYGEAADDDAEEWLAVDGGEFCRVNTHLDEARRQLDDAAFVMQTLQMGSPVGSPVWFHGEHQTSIKSSPSTEEPSVATYQGDKATHMDDLLLGRNSMDGKRMRQESDSSYMNPEGVLPSTRQGLDALASGTKKRESARQTELTTFCGHDAPSEYSGGLRSASLREHRSRRQRTIVTAAVKDAVQFDAAI